MRRSGPPARRTPLSRGAPLRGGGALPARSKRKTADDAEFARARARVLARDSGCRAVGLDTGGGRCQGALHVHHVLPRSRGGGHTDDNLLTLCAWHHAWAHANPSAAKGYGILR